MAVTFLQDRPLKDVCARIEGFNHDYAADWSNWVAFLNQAPGIPEKATQLRSLLISWQACRGNRRRYATVKKLMELLQITTSPLEQMKRLSVRSLASADQLEKYRKDILKLWYACHMICQPSRAASLVGISKTVLMLTEGRIGPAFDSKVCKELYGGSMPPKISGEIWLAMLTDVARDIRAFETKHKCRLESLAPEGVIVAVGRAYDMAAGPRR